MFFLSWGIGAKKTICDGVPVYNNTIGQQNKINWSQFTQYMTSSFKRYPLENSVILPGVSLTLSRNVNTARHVAEEILPAHLVDLGLKIAGQKPK